MFRHALRLHRGGVIGYGAVLAFTALATGATYAKVAGTTAASRLAFARSLTGLAGQFSYLMPAPHRLDTVAGYVLWKGWGALPILSAIWAVLAASGAARGDEDRRLVDGWLASGVSRSRLVATRLAAFGVAALIAAVLLGLGTILGAAGSTGRGVGISAAGVAEQALAFWLFTWACFALAYLVAQVPATTRGALAAAAALLLCLYLLDVGGRTDQALRALSWLSPFRWSDATDALAPGGHLDLTGVALSVALVLAAGLLAAVAFERRDVGRALWPPSAAAGPVRDAEPARALSVPVARLLLRQRGALLMWGLISVLVSVFMVSVAHGVLSTLDRSPALAAILTRGNRGLYVGFVAVFWCSVTQFLLAGLAAQIVSGWGADHTDGVLGAVLSRPVIRTALVLERAAAAAVALTVVAVCSAAAAQITAAAAGTGLPGPGLAGATALLVPFGLTFAAAGAAASTRWPRAAAGVIGLIAFLSFLDTDMAPLMRWPAWAANLSVFGLYGSPLTAPPYWTGLWAMLAIVAVGFGLAALLLRRADIA